MWSVDPWRRGGGGPCSLGGGPRTGRRRTELYATRYKAPIIGRRGWLQKPLGGVRGETGCGIRGRGGCAYVCVLCVRKERREREQSTGPKRRREKKRDKRRGTIPSCLRLGWFLLRRRRPGFCFLLRTWSLGFFSFRAEIKVSGGRFILFLAAAADGVWFSQSCEPGWVWRMGSIDCSSFLYLVSSSA